MRPYRAVLVLLVLLFARVSPAHAAQSGWWWNPAESGRGFFIEVEGDFAYVGAYLYAPDGRADWVVSQGRMSSAMSYSGRLLSFRGGQTLTGDYRAPGTPGDVGGIAIQFDDDWHATLTWPGGTVAIERFAFDGGVVLDPAMPPKTGWWWNGQESGSGFGIEVQGNTLFIVGYVYDDAGDPVWYSSAGSMTSMVSYSGPLLRFARGQSIVGGYRAPAPPTHAGSIALHFTAPDTAELTLSDDAASAAPAGKRTRTRTISRTLPPPAIVPPGSWRGQMSDVIRTTDASGERTLRIDSSAIVWRPKAGAVGALYEPVAGSLIVSHHAVHEGPSGSCTTTGQVTRPITPGDGELRIDPETSVYVLSLRADIEYQATVVCATAGGTVSTTETAIAPLQIEGTAHVIDGVIRGHPRDITSAGPPTTTRTKAWHFARAP